MRGKLTRRDFLEKSMKGICLMSAVPYFLNNEFTRNFNNSEEKKLSLTSYYDHFGINEKMVSDIITSALSKGGDYCDLYFQHSITNSIGLEDQIVNRAYTGVDLGVGIRVIKGDQTGYSFTEEITLNAMKLAALTAASIANSSKNIEPIHFAEKGNIPNYYPVEVSWENVSIDKKIPYLQKINDKVFAEDPRIIKANLSLNNSTSYILIITSEGKIVYDYQPMGQIAVSCIAEKNRRKETNRFDLAGRFGIEFFTPDKIDLLAIETVKRTVALFDAVKPEPGEMEVVLAAGSSGILLHEAIGHGMEADFNRKDISIFSDKMNKQVAEKFVTIVDDATNPNIRGSINVDDEANETERTYLVENGILRSYLHDKISAQYYKIKPTGNGRRESYRYAPQPRMRNTYMMPGPHTKDEIISSVKKGIYAETFTNGQVFIGAGDFTFYVKSGFLIENGKLTKPIKDINIIGNGPEVLKNIVMVADDLKISEGGWTCGKNGQGVPVSQGLPTVKVSKITVGGVK